MCSTRRRLGETAGDEACRSNARIINTPPRGTVHTTSATRCRQAESAALESGHTDTSPAEGLEGNISRIGKQL